MPEPITKEVQNDQGNWTDDYEFVPQEAQTLSREDLEKQILEATERSKKQEEEIRSLREQANTSTALLQGIEKLSNTIATPAQVQPPSSTTEEEIDYEKENAGFFDTPAQAAEKLIDKKLQRMQKEHQSQLTSLQLQISQNNLKSNPVYSRVYEQYGEEIEQVITHTDPKILVTIPDPYLMAAQNVAGRHFEELSQKTTTTGETKNTEALKDPPFTEQSSVSSPKKDKRKVIMTKEMVELKRRAGIIGMPFEEYVKRMAK